MVTLECPSYKDERTQPATRPARESRRQAERRLTLSTLIGTALLYTVCGLAVTWPVARSFNTRLAGSSTDPLLVLRVFHWYKACLFEGESPLFTDGIQYPTGVPLGNFPPLLLPAMLYVPLSLASRNDVLCYNVIWLFNLSLSGLGTFVLGWYLLRERLPALLAGLAVLCSGPLLMHALGHVELMSLGWVALFLVGWMRLVDRPGWSRLFVAAVLYLFVALSAAYFAVFSILPAVLYAASRGFRAASQDIVSWLRSRIGWLLLFGAIVGPCTLLLFANQLWSQSHGYSLARPKGEFNYYGAPLYSYVLPSSFHPLGRLLPMSAYERKEGSIEVECCSYLGIVTLLLLGYSALTRPRFENSRFWWCLLIVSVTLSLGAYTRIGPIRLSLPAEWMRNAFPSLRQLRVPARFNLYAALFAAVLAAAGMQHFLGRIQHSLLRSAIFAGLCAGVISDLSLVPFPTSEISPLPACFAALRKGMGRPTVLDVPQFASGTACELNALYAYWQSQHRCRTTGGYSAMSNTVHDCLFYHPSPFAWQLLKNDPCLVPGHPIKIDIATNARLEDYVWLFLTVHGVDYVVVHQNRETRSGGSCPINRLKSHLKDAKVFEDEYAAVYDRKLLHEPTGPTLVCTTGWRQRDWKSGRAACAVAQLGRVTVFNPLPEHRLTLSLEARSLHNARAVFLRSGYQSLGSWIIEPSEQRRYVSPPLRLPKGLSELTIESDGAEAPLRADMTWEEDPRPFSLIVAGIELTSADNDN